MKRRDFITLLGGAAVAWPIAARGQQGERMRRIGVLMNFAADDPKGRPARGIPPGLQESGWGRAAMSGSTTAGRADTERGAENVAEMVALAPDIIIGHAA